MGKTVLSGLVIIWLTYYSFCWILPFALCPVRVEINCCFILFKKQGPSYWAPLQLSYLALSFQFLPVCCCSYCYCCYLWMPVVWLVCIIWKFQTCNFLLTGSWRVKIFVLNDDWMRQSSTVFYGEFLIWGIGQFWTLFFPFFNLWKFPLILFPHKYS